MLEPVVKEVWVESTPEEAFRRFTDEVASWWPMDTHSVSLAECQDVRFEKEPEPSDANGFIVILLEEDLEGRVHVWGTVQIWDPPFRFVTSWHPGRGPEEAQELEVAFQEKDGGTTVRLTHRAWEALGPRAVEVRGRYDEGWLKVLKRFAGEAGA
jgi:hypothetical protein